MCSIDCSIRWSPRSSHSFHESASPPRSSKAADFWTSPDQLESFFIALQADPVLSLVQELAKLTKSVGEAAHLSAECFRRLFHILLNYIPHLPCKVAASSLFAFIDYLESLISCFGSVNSATRVSFITSTGRFAANSVAIFRSASFWIAAVRSATCTRLRLLLAILTRRHIHV